MSTLIWVIFCAIVFSCGILIGMCIQAIREEMRMRNSKPYWQREEKEGIAYWFPSDRQTES